MSVELILTNKFIEANGAQFQNIFFEIMRAKHGSDFIMPRNYGIYGDLKCDGIHISKGIYYGVYSPENPNFKDVNQSEAIKKFNSDLDGLIALIDENWGYPLKEFVFVYNGKFMNTIPSPILSAISLKHEELKLKYPTVKLSSITQYDLKLVFLTLNVGIQEFILSKTYFSVEEINLDGSIVAMILEKMHLSAFKKSELHAIMDFKDKIKFNGLDDNRASDLLHASYNIDDFVVFVRSIDPQYLNMLHNLCKDLYDKSALLFSNANSQFDYILENLYIYDISDKDYNYYNLKSIKENKLIIISVFFENCSIFKSKK